MQTYFKCRTAKSYTAIGASGKAYRFSADKATEVVVPVDIVSFRRNSSLVEYRPDGQQVFGEAKNKPLSVTKFRSSKPRQHQPPAVKPQSRIEALAKPVAKPEPVKKAAKKKRGRPRKQS